MIQDFYYFILGNITKRNVIYYNIKKGSSQLISNFDFFYKNTKKEDNRKTIFNYKNVKGLTDLYKVSHYDVEINYNVTHYDLHSNNRAYVNAEIKNARKQINNIKKSFIDKFHTLGFRTKDNNASHSFITISNYLIEEHLKILKKFRDCYSVEIENNLFFGRDYDKDYSKYWEYIKNCYSVLFSGHSFNHFREYECQIFNFFNSKILIFETSIINNNNFYFKYNNKQYKLILPLFSFENNDAAINIFKNVKFLRLMYGGSLNYIYRFRNYCVEVDASYCVVEKLKSLIINSQYIHCLKINISYDDEFEIDNIEVNNIIPKEIILDRISQNIKLFGSIGTCFIYSESLNYFDYYIINKNLICGGNQNIIKILCEYDPNIHPEGYIVIKQFLLHETVSVTTYKKNYLKYFV